MSANKQLLLGNVASGTYEPNAVKFDGANDYLTRGADLTGLVDGTAGLFSSWVRLDDADATLQTLLANLLSTARFNVTRTAANKFRFFARTSVPATILDQATTATYQSSAKWIHLLASWDLTAATAYIYINDVADVASTTKTNGTIDYVTATPNWSIGSETDGTNKFYGSLAEVYFTNTFLDISNSTNRRKFISASGLPVSLGSDGSTPTGTAPIIYLKGDASAFGVNSGTGGNFTVNGTLEKASTTPATIPAWNAVVTNASDFVRNSSNLTGVSDSGTFILSFWTRMDNRGSIGYWMDGGADTIEIAYDSSGMVIRMKNAAAAYVLSIDGATTHLPASNQWRHVLLAVDLSSSANRAMYIDGVSVTPNWSTYTVGGTIDWTTPSAAWTIGGYYTGALYFHLGALSEFYFAPGQYLDLSSQANREKFILAGAPVSIGSDGSLPTGTAPAIYLPNRAALVGTNAGTGGNFTINGAPKDANSTPVYYYAEPATFDGTNDYMLRGADLTGIADGKTFTLSCFIRVGGAGTQLLIDNSGDYFYIYWTAANLYVYGLNAAGAAILTASISFSAASDVWRHVLISIDLTSTSNRAIYVNNAAASVTWTTYTNDSIDFTRVNWAVGGAVSSSNKMFATIADLWFNTTYLDISQSANRAKFIDQTTLRPVPLGAKGELPTGSQPLLYLGRDYSNFQTNLGSGGNFTVTGALTRGTTSPSDVKA